MSDESHDPEAFETIRQLYAYEGTVTWNRYNAMLVANGILVAAIGVFWKNAEPLMAGFLIVAGLAVCALWSQLTHIGFRMQREYLRWGKEFEENKATEAAKIFTRAAKVRQGWLGVEGWARLVIGLFVIIYVCAAVLLLSSHFHSTAATP
jgi:Flp pilus assembly protein TadB